MKKMTSRKIFHHYLVHISKRAPARGKTKKNPINQPRSLLGNSLRNGRKARARGR